MGRWVTLDCYGTMVDWNAGLGGALSGLWPSSSVARLLNAYHEQEPLVEKADPSATYRTVLRRTLEAVAQTQGLELRAGDRNALAESLPDWPVFEDVCPALGAVREQGWRLAVLSNVDPDLLAGSLARVGVPVDDTVTAREAGAYKPARNHWQEFLCRRSQKLAAHVHVGASTFHDIAPAAELGIPAVWVNRLGESSDLPRIAELASLTGLGRVLVPFEDECDTATAS